MDEGRVVEKGKVKMPVKEPVKEAGIFGDMV